MTGRRKTVRRGGPLANRKRRRQGTAKAATGERIAEADGAGAHVRPRRLSRTDARPSGPASGGTPYADPGSARDPAGSLGDGWLWSGILLGIGTIGLISLFRSTTWSMVETWASSASFSHGFANVPICAYLVWLRRRELAQMTPKPSMWGVGVAAAAAFAWLLGDLAGAQVVEQFALVAMIQGLTLAVVGVGAVRVLKFPLLYLYFAVPFGLFLVPPLQDFTAEFVVRVLRITGIPVHLDGIFLQIPSGMFKVAEACAGVRFLISSVALGVLFAYLTYHQLWRRLTFIALSIAVPIVANGFRAYGIVMLAHYSDYRLAANTDHITYGLIFLSFVLFLLLGFGMALRERHRSTDSAAPTELPGRGDQGTPSLALHLTAAVAVMLTAGAASAYAGYVEYRAAGSAAPNMNAPDVARPWAAMPSGDAGWRPNSVNPDAELFQSYSDGNRRVDLYIAYYTQQRQGAEAVHGQNSFLGGASWERVARGRADAIADGQELTVAYTRIRSRSRHRVVWHWYWVDGQFTANPYFAKLLEVRAKLLGGVQAAAAIGLAADYADRPEEAVRAITDLLDRFGPIGAPLKRSAQLPVDG